MCLKFFLWFLWIQLAWLSTEQLQQSPEFLSIEAGKDVTMHCNSSSTFPSIQWYRQKPGGGPVPSMTLTKGGEVKKQKSLSAQFGEERTSSSLRVTAAQPGDSGTYICAGTRCSGGTWRLHQNHTAPSPSGSCSLSSWCVW